MAAKKSRPRAASNRVAGREIPVGRGTVTGRFRDGKPKLVVATKAPAKTDVQAGVERLAQVAKTSNVDVSVFNALIDQLAEAMTDRQSTELGLTEHEASFLIESGDFTPEEFAEAAAFVTSGGLAKLERETHVRALTNTYTASEVAALLGIDASSVRHRQSKNTLYGFRAGRVRLYPRWQFILGEKASTIPHLPLLVRAIPSDWDPADVEGFMTTPQDELRPSDDANDRNEWMTPIEWLAAAKDPAPVVGILEDADIT
ncbi:MULTISPECIES: hypothetical protein [Microbacterium]|uniref:Helix-turn-helix domain-containing protein n=1 Tax=Microbacterium maritypicum TaxID=33918 RepID=A0AAJ6ANX6_MICMQ|nr:MULTISPECIES: hypothetical protein [Microbacterium]WEF21338.1 hypothetical protein PWF71_01330 [Microbacterium liquefaciens]